MLCALIVASPPAVVALREVVVDLEQRRMPRERASAPVTIVEIDERSLARHGQWPWPRSQVATLIERIGAAGPAAIGLDLLFPEPDRYSPAALAGLLPQLPQDVSAQLRKLPGNDELLAQALRAHRVVLAFAGLDDGESDSLHTFGARLSSIDELARAAAGQGLISAESPARVVRRVPVVARVEGRIVPSLGIEMLRVATGAPAISVGPADAGLLEVRFGDVRVPAQADGSAWIRYTRHDPGRFVSAAAVLDGSADRELLESKLVLVAVTGLALVDHLATPLNERVPGVEMHAQLIEQVFEGAYLVRPAWASWAEASFLAAAAALLIVVVPTRRVRISVAALAGLLLVVIVIAVVAFRSGLLIDFAWPAIGVVLAFAMLVAAALFSTALDSAMNSAAGMPVPATSPSRKYTRPRSSGTQS